MQPGCDESKVSPSVEQEQAERAQRAATGLSSAEMALAARLGLLARRTVDALAERAALPPDQQGWVLLRVSLGLHEKGLHRLAASVDEEIRRLDENGAPARPDPDDQGPQGSPPPTGSASEGQGDAPPPTGERRTGVDRRAHSRR